MTEKKNVPKRDDEEEASELVIIGRYKTARLAHEAGLAVLASGHHYWVYPDDEAYVLAVHRTQAEMLRREVDIAALKNQFWPPVSLDIPSSSTRKLPTALFALGLIAAFVAQNVYPKLKELGMNSSEGVVNQGEWWRLFTAITLHADLAHLAGNLLGISLFTYLCCRYMGNGLAWFLIIALASLSNVTNAFLRVGDPFFSLGASTAVFAALGLLTGFPIGAFLKTREPIQSRDWMIPFFGGCILFAWMGGGEFPTDVAGHLWSFIYGLLVATAISWTGFHSRLSNAQQTILLGLTWGLLAASWIIALGL